MHLEVEEMELKVWIHFSMVTLHACVGSAGLRCLRLDVYGQ